MNKVFIIIPVHNRKQYTRNCLLSLKKQTFKSFVLIVVDDGSTDGTSEMIEQEFPEVVLLHGDGNLWWTRATNLGVEYALTQADQDDYILTLNDDTMVRPTYLQALLDSALNLPNSLIGSISISSIDESTVVDAGVRINWLTAKFNRLKRYIRYEDIINSEKLLHSVDVLPGRGTLISTEVFRDIGLYDFEHLPHYGADYEFSRRANKNGYELYINYNAVVISCVHSTGINNESRTLSYAELAKSFISIRSPYNIRTRWNFARLASPKYLFLTFFILDFGRVVCGSFRNQLKTKLQRY